MSGLRKISRRHFFRKIKNETEHDLIDIDLISRNKEEIIKQDIINTPSDVERTPLQRNIETSGFTVFEPNSSDASGNSSNHSNILSCKEKSLSCAEDNVAECIDREPKEWNFNHFKNELRNWVVTESINLSSVSPLLKILKSHKDFQDLPIDPRTLLQTPRSTELKQICGGSYVYFGVAKGIVNILKNRKTPQSLQLLIGVDGLPIAKSSGSQLWPQIGKIRSLKDSPLFIIGVFHGHEKPNHVNELLLQMVTELKFLVENGITLNKATHPIQISHIAFVCDAPARSLILHTKGHTGFFSCPRCEVEGEFLCNRVCFPCSDLQPIRTHDSFIRRAQVEYHNGDTILTNLPGLNIIKDFPQDYMHLVCLGVAKKILNLWLRGNLKYRLPSRVVNKMSSILKSFAKFIPSDFARKPRGLDELPRWKATELRQFLLYTGPVLVMIIKDMNAKVVNNFLCLSVAIRLLLNHSTCHDYQNYANSLLHSFVKDFKKIYGKHLVSHNVHGLLHISSDVSVFGSLDNCSAFAFENYMQKLKRFVRKSNQPLQQIARRMEEIAYSESENYKKSLISNQISFKSNHKNGPLTEQCTDPQYSSVQLIGFKVSSNLKDSHCKLKDGTIVRVRNIAFSQATGKMIILAHELERCGDLFQKPCKSNKIDIDIVKLKSTDLKVSPIEDICQKLMMLPYKKNIFVSLPLVHSEG